MSFSLSFRFPFLPLFSVFLVVVGAGTCDGRLLLPQLGVREWKSHDSALKTRLAPLHSSLAADLISPSEAARDFSSVLADFLGGIDVFKGGEGWEGRRRRSNDTDISDEAYDSAKREKRRLRRLQAKGAGYTRTGEELS